MKLLIAYSESESEEDGIFLEFDDLKWRKAINKIYPTVDDLPIDKTYAEHGLNIWEGEFLYNENGHIKSAKGKFRKLTDNEWVLMKEDGKLFE